ncbi:MAG: sigma-54 dependent transcriptional regulator [Planctomycetaceae bacterium]
MAVSDGWYPLDLAEDAFLTSSGHLEVPLSGEESLEKFRLFLGSENQSNNQNWIPESRTLTSGNRTLRTYAPEMFEMIEQLQQIAARDVTLLLIGETGTGKTTLAEIVHELSDRCHEPVHQVACGALPKDLIESELFGHVRGAFTSADADKVGRFEAAGRGTVLLDEIDVLGEKEQVKLLRVIETGRFEPVGSTETRESQARLIAASNVNLESLTEQKRFRSDLYYRLNVLQFVLLPLRQRVVDIVPLSIQFIRECCQRHGITVRKVSVSFLKCLQGYHWPGNLRELKNQIQRSVLFCKDKELHCADLSPEIRLASSGCEIVDQLDSTPKSLAERLAISERRILETELRRNNDSRTATAKSLGISRVGLYKKLRRHGIM